MSAQKTGAFLMCLLSLGAAVSESRAMSPFLTLSGGPAWTNSLGYTQTYFIQPEVEKTFVAIPQNSTLINGELFIGTEQCLSSQVYGQFGLAWGISNSAKLSGNVWDDADAEFNNHDYFYRVAHNHIALKSKVLRDMAVLKPYLSASLGVGFNESHSYSNLPTIFGAYSEPNFSDNTTTTFTYTLGFGFQKPIYPGIEVGMGYEFGSWGGSRIGRAPGQTMGDGLATNPIYVNALMLNLTYQQRRIK